MLYAFPIFLVIRFMHPRFLAHLRNVAWYGAAWLLLILLCYQAFTDASSLGDFGVFTQRAYMGRHIAGVARTAVPVRISAGRSHFGSGDDGNSGQR